MDNTTKEIINTTRIVHKITCDLCRKLITESREYEDGYFDNPGEYRRSFYIPACGCYAIKMDLCDECKVEMDKKTVRALERIGFKNENN